jgi:putative flippase GtrA
MSGTSGTGGTGAAGPTTAGRLLRRLYDSVDVVYREIVKFGTVGVLAFVVDTGLFNLLRVGLAGEGTLASKPLTAKTISAFVATVVAWLGNRLWTFRHRRQASPRREFALFLLMNVTGLAIALACLGISHYVLRQTSPLADNIAGNVVGLGLGTLFRFWAYRRFVFVETGDGNGGNDGNDDAGTVPAPAGAAGIVPAPAAPTSDGLGPGGGSRTEPAIVAAADLALPDRTRAAEHDCPRSDVVIDPSGTLIDFEGATVARAGSADLRRR